MSAKLLLEDGTEYTGRAFGAKRAVAGEVVFNTAMTGYVEALTDPSYRGQILVLTYPLAGNYGVPRARPAGSLDGPFESSVIQLQGLVVQTHVASFSHHAAETALGQWLRSEDVPGLTGVDTRGLTRKIREHGTLRGWIVPAHADVDTARAEAHAVDMREEVFRLVAPHDVLRCGRGSPDILVVDVGAKDNIVRSLLRRGVGVTRAPWHADIEALAKTHDAVLIGNGPGDPKDLHVLVAKIRKVLALETKPVFGVCLGNQILALAAGGDTGKLPYGHRGINQPVQDLLTRRCFITSQNHGFAVVDASLPPDWEPWFVNLNDGTNEGIRSRYKPYMSVQFHPEACPGPQDTGFLFDDFVRLAGAARS